MKQYLLSLLALIFSVNAYSAQAVEDNAEKKASKVFFRCESLGMGFNDESKMKEVAPGRFEMKLAVPADHLEDRCVVSIVDGEVTEKEVYFVDYFPNLDSKESVAVGKSYSLQTGSNNPTFGIKYDASAPHTVTYDLKSQAFAVQKAKVSKAGSIIAVNK